VCSLAVSCARPLPDSPASASIRGRAARSYCGSIASDNDVVVTLRPGVDAVQFGLDHGAALLASDESGCTAYRPGPDETPDQLALDMGGDPRTLTSERNMGLESAEARQQAYAFDDGQGTPGNYAEQPAMSAVHVDQAHLTSTGQGVWVAILDTGAELDHPALLGRIAGGVDLVDGDADPTDRPDGLDNDGDGVADEAWGHGTHVAGIVARLAPDARLLIVRVLDAEGRGDVMGVASGIEWAAAHGARVINLSLGMLSKSAAIAYQIAEADARGTVCVASAGNWGAEEPEEYPARDSHVLAVAAVDALGLAAPWTSFGDFVAVSGPGVAVRSAYVHGSYALWSGTSMAAPFLSGTAALLLSIHPDWDRSMVMSRIASGSRPLLTLNPLIGEELGAGALDAGAALAPDARTSEGAMDPEPPFSRRLPP
jgi:subtilisin family serine protease